MSGTPPLTPAEEAEIRRLDAAFDPEHPRDFARPEWLGHMLMERRRLLATLDATRSEPAGLREAIDDLHRWGGACGWPAFNAILVRIDAALAPKVSEP